MWHILDIEGFLVNLCTFFLELQSKNFQLNHSHSINSTNFQNEKIQQIVQVFLAMIPYTNPLCP